MTEFSMSWKAPQKKFLKKNKAGGVPVAATLDLTVATTATGTGTITVYVCGDICQYTFASDETPTAIGDGIALAMPD